MFQNCPKSISGYDGMSLTVMGVFSVPLHTGTTTYPLTPSPSNRRILTTLPVAQTAPAGPQLGRVTFCPLPRGIDQQSPRTIFFPPRTTICCSNSVPGTAHFLPWYVTTCKFTGTMMATNNTTRYRTHIFSPPLQNCNCILQQQSGPSSGPFTFGPLLCSSSSSLRGHKCRCTIFMKFPCAKF